MTNITFTQTTGGSAAVTVSASVVFGTIFDDTRMNQFKVETADGGLVVYDNGPNLVQGILLMKGISYDSGRGLYNWIRDSIIFSKENFSISAISNVDLGLGVNTQITSVRWNKDKTTDGIFELVAPRQWNISFPYRFVRS